MKRLFLLLLMSIGTISAFSNHPMVRNFARNNYKAGTQNWAITQYTSNWMYFANNAGLLEFDGKDWSIFPINNRTNVRSVLCTPDGRIYAGATNEFGYYQQQKTGELKYYSLVGKLNKKFRGFNEVWNIHNANKSIYFQADKSIFRYDNDTVVCFPLKNKIDASAYLHNILFVASSQVGVFMLNGDLFIQIPGSEILKNKKVCSILPFQDNKTLFVTSFNGVFLFDGRTITHYNTGIDNFLKSNQVFCAATNGKQLVYGTVQRGIAVQNIVSGSIDYVNTFSGLQNNTVLSVAFDNQQNLWLGLDKGIDYVMLNCPILNMFGTNNLYGAGYTSLLKNNMLFFGTNQGLYTSSYPLPNGPLPLQLNMVKGMEGQVWCLTEIDNTLFCGNDQGAFILYPNRTERISSVQGTWSFKQLKKHPDMILGCSYQGLFILKKVGKVWKFAHFIKGKFYESSNMFEEDKDGNIWFSHWQKGLFKLHFNSGMDSITQISLYDRRKGFPTNRNNTVFQVDNDMMFSSEYGFYYYNKKTDRMIPYEKWNKLFVSPPNSIRLHQAKNGDVWCVSGSFFGIAKKESDNSYQMDSLSYHIIQPKIIVGFEHLNFIDADNVILGTEDGFSWIDLRRKTNTKSTFKISLRSVYITKEKDLLVTRRCNDLNITTQNTFTHKQNSLRFEYIAPEYRNEGMVQYSYMLQNYDDTWSSFSEGNVKEYTQLPKGKYVFKVRARNVLESKEAMYSYPFTILPAWYETTVAFIIYAILLTILILTLINFINQRSERGAREMEKRKEIELKEQEKRFEADAIEKKKEIIELKNQRLNHELRHKSQELASSTMNLIRKNEILLEITDNLSKVASDINSNQENNVVLSRLNKMERSIKQNIENDNNWKRFEENFDLVYENYLKRLSEEYPDLTISDKKLCAYLKMDLSSKDIAPLLNISIRSVEMSRYRLRKKMNLDRDTNLGEFLQRL